MENRFTELYRSDEPHYSEGSPAVIETVVLYRDNGSNRVLAQLRLRNIQPKMIQALRVSIRAYDRNGAEVEGIPVFTYAGFQAGQGQEFGTGTPVYLPGNTACRIAATVIGAEFTDRTVWPSAPYGRAVPNIQEPVKGTNAGKGKLKKALLITIPIAAVLILAAVLLLSIGLPLARKSSAYQAAVRMLEDGDYDDAKEAFKELEDYKDSWELALESDYRKAESLAAKGEYDKAADIWKRLGNYSDSKERMEQAGVDKLESIYQGAEALMKEGKYPEAKEIYDSLADYKDSVRKSKECIDLQEDALYLEDYNKALTLMEAGKYDEAAAAFSDLAGYRDAEAKVEECAYRKQDKAYQDAMTLVDNGEFEAAMAAFQAMKDYKDAPEQYKRAAYLYGKQLYEKERFKSAIEYFELAGDYEDAAEWVLETKYSSALSYIKKREYVQAVGILEDSSMQAYKDGKQKLQEARYAYVKANRDFLNTTTYKYLSALKASDYADSKSIYDDLFTLKADILINKGNSSVKWNERTYVIVTFKGMVPDTNYNFDVTVTYPNGNVEHHEVGYKPKGSYTWNIWWDDGCMTGPASGTFTVTVYDQSGKRIGTESIKVTQ